MPIRVQCSCGAAFAAPDKYAGKSVKCPKCGNPLAIPAATAAAAPAPVAAAAPNPYAQPGRDLFSEAGIKSMPAGATFCPGCGKPMANNAVLCIQCGYHREKGRKLESTSTGGGGGGGGGGGHGGHGGEPVAATLARAAAALDEAKVEESKTRSQGLPAWVYGGALIGLLLLTYYMATIGVGGSLVTLGFLIIGGSVLVDLYYGLLILVAASKEGALQLLLMFVPFYQIYFIATRWDKVGNYFLMQLYAGTAIGFGYGFIFVGAIVKATEKAPVEESELLRQLTMMLG